MPQPIIGRKNELETLERVFQSPKSEFAILYGRRRVGKTFLVNQKFDGQFTFRMTALANVPISQQLLNFQATITNFDPAHAGAAPPKKWFEAFQQVIKLAEKSPHNRKVIFFDELPWFDTYGSDFVTSLEHFWNSWASLRSDVLLIGCGSAAAWMMNKLIHDPGGLHNRITERILLMPFTLSETEAFLQSKGGKYDRYQLLQLYMVMGGIPFYLDNILTNRSVAQNIDRMYFSASGILRTEYGDLYRSLFTSHERHVSVVEALSKKNRGLSRKEVAKASGLSNGGSLTKVLDELEHSGFIKRYFPFGKSKRDSLYQLNDPFTLFYLTFVRDSKMEGEGAWLSQLDSPRWRAWSGSAFEFLCRYHVNSIKKHLGISGIYTEISAWQSKLSENGAQIDLVIDRNDRVINLCEMKFSIAPYSITKSYAENLQNKLHVFRAETKTRKTLFLTMITTFGLKQNEYSVRLVQDELGMEALFD